MKASHLVRLLTLSAALTMAVAAIAALPQTINYQGYLKNTDDTPVSTITSIRFSLYSSNPARNNPVWAETRSVNPSNGIYSTQLGSVTPITAPFDVPYYLGVQVQSDQEMVVLPLSSVGYAFRAGMAEGLRMACQDGGVMIYKSGVWQCGTVTTLPNAAATCVGNNCTISACSPGYVNCNILVADGCEVNIASDPNNCNSCGTKCSSNNIAIPSCSSGICNGVCNGGFADCDSNRQTNGCETSITTNINCGMCGRVCTSGYSCFSGNCKKIGGQMCSADTECGSGFCTDGVCCESRCRGTCEKCNLTGRLGFCDAIPAGTNPDNECTAQSVSTCGTIGFCSGARSCALYSSGTVAVAATCSSGVYTSASTCNGIGSVISGGSVSCSPYVCNGSTACFSSCTLDPQCISGYACAAGGVCKKAAGNICSIDNECASGFCTDGVCCQSRCGGTCEKCNQTGRLGFCDAIPAGTDPDNECLLACNGARGCQ